MDQLLQHGLNALMLGSTYALLGIGLTLIFGIMKVVNFTHGELYAFGAYMMYALVMLLGVNFFVALPLAIALGAASWYLLEQPFMKRAARASRTLGDGTTEARSARSRSQIPARTGPRPASWSGRAAAERR